MQVRAARTEDAPEACLVVRRSITELCLADHQGDPAILQRWLANKTPANLSSWIAGPDNHMFVATEGDAILGVACVTTCGEVILNYVSPDVRFRGASKALLQRLEAKAAELGNERCVLTSTARLVCFIFRQGMRRRDYRRAAFSRAQVFGWQNGSVGTANRDNQLPHLNDTMPSMTSASSVGYPVCQCRRPPSIGIQRRSVLGLRVISSAKFAWPLHPNERTYPVVIDSSGSCHKMG